MESGMGGAAFLLAFCLPWLFLLSGGCSSDREPASQREEPPVRIRMATTTSTEDSGLLAVLLPAFEEVYNIRVDVIAVGTGKALKLGEQGDVDVVLVHAPEAEQVFVDAGYGVDRRAVMYNDFLLLGPRGDAAGVSKAGDLASAFRGIEEARAPFVSRGDASGTHQKERTLWKQAGIEPTGAWYVEAGQGMGATLTMADEKRAYTLADRATYVAMRDRLELAVVRQGDPELLNPYHVIAVNPARQLHVHYKEVSTFITWLTSPEGQTIIGGFRKDGEVLFHPAAEPAGR